MKYEKEGQGKLIGKGYTSFFEDTKNPECEPLSCFLGKADDCLTPYTGDKVTMDEQFPYQLRALNNVNQGYTSKICVVCKTLLDYHVYNNYKVTQNTLDCSDVLNSKSVPDINLSSQT